MDLKNLFHFYSIEGRRQKDNSFTNSLKVNLTDSRRWSVLSLLCADPPVLRGSVIQRGSRGGRFGEGSPERRAVHKLDCN